MLFVNTEQYIFNHLVNSLSNSFQFDKDNISLEFQNRINFQIRYDQKFNGTVEGKRKYRNYQV